MKRARHEFTLSEPVGKEVIRCGAGKVAPGQPVEFAFSVCFDYGVDVLLEMPSK